MSSTIEPDAVTACSSCGASIYREHIDRGLAGRWAGQLLCPHCLAEKRQPAPAEPDHATPGDPAAAPAAPPGRSSTFAGFASLVDADTSRRPLLPAGRGATRLRIFHCKLSDGPLAQLNRQVNEWLDAHADVEVKFATNAIGTWEGRHAEQQFILTLYY